MRTSPVAEHLTDTTRAALGRHLATIVLVGIFLAGLAAMCLLAATDHAAITPHGVSAP